jgi:hypothetical protein
MNSPTFYGSNDLFLSLNREVKMLTNTALWLVAVSLTLKGYVVQFLNTARSCTSRVKKIEFHVLVRGMEVAIPCYAVETYCGWFVCVR